MFWVMQLQAVGISASQKPQWATWTYELFFIKWDLTRLFGPAPQPSWADPATGKRLGEPDGPSACSWGPVYTGLNEKQKHPLCLRKQAKRKQNNTVIDPEGGNGGNYSSGSGSINVDLSIHLKLDRRVTALRWKPSDTVRDLWCWAHFSCLSPGSCSFFTLTDQSGSVVTANKTFWKTSWMYLKAS